MGCYMERAYDSNKQETIHLIELTSRLPKVFVEEIVPGDEANYTNNPDSRLSGAGYDGLIALCWN